MIKFAPTAALVLAAATTHAATITSQINAPSIGANDIAQLVSPASDTDNIGGTGITYSADNDGLTYVASDRTTQGQLFTTVAANDGFLLNSIWVRHVGYSSYLDNGTWANLGDGSQVALRVVDPSQAGAAGFVVHAETATVASGSGFSGGGNWNGTGRWIKIALANPIVLEPDTQYGFDLTSYSPWFELAGMEADQYAGGAAYTTAGDEDLNTGTVHGGDRTFVIDLASANIPPVSIISNSNTESVVTWVADPSEFLLLQTTNLTEGSWDYAGLPVTGMDGTNSVANTIDRDARFFRLKRSDGEHLVPVVSVQQDADGATLEMDPGMMKLQVFSPRVVRVAYSLTNAIPTNSLAVIASSTNSGWTLSETPDAIRLATSSLEVRVNRNTGSVGFYDTNGMALLKEQAGGGKTLVPTTLPTLNGLDEESFVLKQSFELGDGEALSGLGQFHNDGVMNRVGQSRVLLQENQDAVIPVLLSSKGYALLWDSAAITTVDVVSSISNRVSWSSEAGDAVDYYFCYGPDPDDAIAGYRHLTGAPPLFGKWAWGFWQCRERYRTQAELLDIVDTYRSMNIPLDGIIQDWQYWPALNDSTAEGGWGSHEFDASRYPDPQAMVDAVHDTNVHIIISVWPKFDVTSGGTSIPNLQDLETVDGALDPVIPYVYPAGQGKWLDPFSTGGRQAYWQGLSDHLFSFGFDGWWLDGSEPELSGNWGELREFDTALGVGAKVHNAYSLMQTAGVYEGQREENPDKRVFILTRSGFAGQQRNAAVTWSGDIAGTWGVLAEQIPAGLNFSAAGVPYWNTDIGGFFGGQPSDPGYAELYTRWFQYGAFCPMFRSHASTGGNDNYAVEIWRFPAATQTRLIDFVNLRYHLIPYIYSVSWMVTSEGYTMMRPLMMDFPADSNVYDIGNQYMFGPALMACPVTSAGASSRDVYLPAGTSWYDFWTGNTYSGGQTISASVPIEKMPIFVRSGSVLPYGPDIQYATESVDPMEIRVYRGAVGSFTLYEDENDGYDYESGSYATIPFTWDESAQSLTIGARQGSFPGMLSNRTFRVVWVDAGHGTGIANTATADEIVNYTGAEMVVSPTP